MRDSLLHRKQIVAAILGVMAVFIGAAAGVTPVANAAVITCPWLTTCNGTNNDDHMTGSDMGTYIYGYDGHDNIWGMPGSDTINAGDSADYVEGNPGNDEIFGLYGNDSSDYYAYNAHPAGLYGSNDDDIVRGNDGFDLVVGGYGNDYVFGGDNNDMVQVVDCQRDEYSGGQGPSDECWYDAGIDAGDGTCEIKHPIWASC